MAGHKFWGFVAAVGVAAPIHAEEAPIVVTARVDPYRAVDVAAARTGTALRDLPQSVTVLTRARIDDQAQSQLGAALRYVPGVTLGQGEGHRDQIVVRGQASTADFFADGLRDDAQYYRPLYNAERVEVLRGANALLFGRGGGGGIVNRVSKSPTFGPATAAVAGSLDSYGAWALSGDGEVPLATNAALRVNATYERLATHRDTFGGHFAGIAPTLALRQGGGTELTLAYEYGEDRRVTDRGVPSLGGTPIRGYTRTFFGDPAANQSRVTAHTGRVRLRQELAGNLTLDASLLAAHFDKYYGNVLPRGATATTVELEGYSSAVVRDNRIAQAVLVWTPVTGMLHHTVLAGIETGTQDTDGLRNEAQFVTPAGSAARVTVALARRLTLPQVRFGPTSRSTLSHVRTLSGFVQDQIAIGAHVEVVAGARYDVFRIDSINRVNGFAAQRSDAMWSPRAALIVKPAPNLSLYASYARSFLPQSGDQFTVLDATTATLAPEGFRNLELGAKWDPLAALSLTAALYRIDRSNTRAADPATGNPVLTGASRSEGFEASLSGRLAPRWQASFGLALQRGTIRSATTAAPAGRRLDKLPAAQVTAWTRYDVSTRLGFGVGVVHQSGQFATISNAVRLPGFTRIDGAIYLRVSPALSLQLNAENLTNTAYFASAHTDYNIAPGAPRSVRLGVKVGF